MEERIQLDREVRTIYELAQLDQFAEREFVVNIQLGSLNKLVVRFVGEVKNFASYVYAVYKPAKCKEIADFKRSLNFAEMKLDSGSKITLYAKAFRSTEQFIGGIH